MSRHTRRLDMLGVAMVAFILGLAPAGWARVGAVEIPLDEAELFFELNNTDGDLGIHSKVDGGPWTHLEILDRKGGTLMEVSLNGRLRTQGLTELFFESAEPPFDELDPRTFFDRFPEGEYEFEGLTQNQEELEGETELTHLLPAPPDNVRVSGLRASENCDVDDLPEVDGDEPVIISWNPVTHSHPDLGRTGERIEVVRYEVVVEREEPSPLVFKVDLPPSVTDIEIPVGFIALGEEFKFEILVQEASGNRTAIESCFETD